MMNLEIDLEKVKKDLSSIYRDLSKDKIEQASYRALNHTTAKAKTEAAKYARKKMRVKSSSIKKQIIIQRARKGKMWAALKSANEPMRVKEFAHSQRRKGVAVGISPGRRKLINRAFVQRMRNGHVGVFARGRYGPGGFKFDKRGDGTKGRGKITQLRTTTVAQKLDDTALLHILRRKTYTDYPTRLGYLLGRASSFGASPFNI